MLEILSHTFNLVANFFDPIDSKNQFKLKQDCVKQALDSLINYQTFVNYLYKKYADNVVVLELLKRENLRICKYKTSTNVSKSIDEINFVTDNFSLEEPQILLNKIHDYTKVTKKVV